jgi:hypothetical protein
VGWLRSVVVDAADPSRLVEFSQGVPGVGVAQAESDLLPLPPDVAHKACGREGTPDSRGAPG